MSITTEAPDCIYLDFLYKLPNGLIFSFSAEHNPDDHQVLLNDLETFLQTFDVEKQTEEILEGITQLTPSVYFQIRREIEDIQVRVWHLWLELGYLSSKNQILDLPDHSWN